MDDVRPLLRDRGSQGHSRQSVDTTHSRQAIDSAPSAFLHGGAMDPNEVRRRLAHGQQTSPSPAHIGQGFDSNAASGQNDPKAVRSHLTSTQQLPSPSNPFDNGSGQGTPSIAQNNVDDAAWGEQFPDATPSHHLPNQAGPQQRQFTSAGQRAQSPDIGSALAIGGVIPMVDMQAQRPGTSQNLNPYTSGAPSQPWPMNRALGSHTQEDVEAFKHHQSYVKSPSYKRRRFKWSRSYQSPGSLYPGGRRRHRDVMNRAAEFDPYDYYLSPTDGHLAKLYVQCTREIYQSESNSTWGRTSISNESPLLLRVAHWVMSPDARDAPAPEFATMFAKWLPSCVLIFFLMLNPRAVEGEVRNGGNYDVFPYKYWGYPYHARNYKEDKKAAFKQHQVSSQNPDQRTTGSVNPIAERPLEPNFLCFLKEDKNVEIRDVQEWKREHQKAAEYIFVSYTSEQFGSDEEQLLLHDIGWHAAKAAKVPAYWVGCSCLGDESQLEENVWRISDVIRGAHSMVIAVSNTVLSGKEERSTEDLLERWGTRLWTLPEVLLSPSHQRILVYARGKDLDKPLEVYKRNFATVWADAPISRELIDHFEGSVSLSPVELITIGLRCLSNRQTGKYLEGDMSYALMGLLRRRPTVVSGDSAFQAFARLSLANDSNLLLERLICILPKSRHQAWYNLEDQWDVSLWDIYPTTQICGIGDNDTVIIDGAYAASIRWKSFAFPTPLFKDSWKRFCLRYALRISSYHSVAGIALLVTVGISGSKGANILQPFVVIGALLLTSGLLFILLSPYLIHVLYGRRIWARQPWFFGFEGYMDISTIERHIYGGDTGQLQWSTAGSPLSVHSENEHGECIGEDPLIVKDTEERVRPAIPPATGEERIYTLVDTNTMTVTLFAAVRPPVAVVLCGEEGGMQRAMLCSYEWSSQTLYRESVLRMETPVRDKMSRLGRFRFGFSRDGRFS